MQEIVFTSNVCLAAKERNRHTEWFPWLANLTTQNFVPITPPQYGGKRLMDSSPGKWPLNKRARGITFTRSRQSAANSQTVHT